MNVIKNADKIVKGAVNAVMIKRLKKDLQKVIEERRSICGLCEYNSKNAVEAGWYQSERPDDHCVMCDCNIKMKTASLDSSCGIEVYNLENNENLELKWEKIEK